MVDADLPFAEEVYVSTRAEELAQTGWPIGMQREFLRQQFELQHTHYRNNYSNPDWLIIECGGQPVGRLYLDSRPAELRIIDIALIPESRGKGYGTAILTDLLEDSAVASRCVTIHVERNNPARSLYLRLGFQPIDEHGVYELMEWNAPNGAPS